MTEETDSAQAPVDDRAQLNAVDIAKMAQLVALAIKRGAYEPTELKEVGETYEKVSQFLQFYAQAAKAAATQTGEEDGDS
jgi:hexokinase